MNDNINLVVLPRHVMTWEAFVASAPKCSIALDGIVTGGPNWNERTLHVNFDHHDSCIREATMSTAKQVMFAIKGGLMERFDGNATIYVNDPDQDTSFAVWLISRWKSFTGVQSHPIINRFLELSDRLDITGGAYPMSLDERVLQQHTWVFSPYSDLRKSGALAAANESVIRNCIQSVMNNLTQAFMGSAGLRNLDTRHHVLYESPRFKVIEETGGNDARFALFAEGKLDGYVSLVARRPDGRNVYTIGRRSRYVDFPVQDLYGALSAEDDAPWGGSDIIGGSNRERGSSLSPKEVAEVINERLDNPIDLSFITPAMAKALCSSEENHD